MTRSEGRRERHVRVRRGPWVVLLVASSLLGGCELVARDESSELDRQLETALRTASATGDLSYFILPESDDFASIPQDPRNPLSAAKVALGQLLFHDAGLAVDPRRPEMHGTWSCASCHHARAGFQAGVRQGIGEGGVGFGVRGEARVPASGFADEELDVQPIRSPSVMNSAYQEAMLWNGQFGATGINADTRHRWTPGSPKEVNYLGFEGVETQSISGLGVHRMGNLSTSIIATDPTYRQLWDEVFPGVEPNPIEAGLAIAAYERTVLSNRAPFQRWLKGERGALSIEEKEGAALFFGKAACFACHSGPALSSMSFHALGMADLSGPDVRFDPRDRPKPLGRGAFTLDPEDAYCFKTPQIYNLDDAVFLGHGASFSSVRSVIEYKNLGVPEATVPAAQLSPLFVPLGLSEAEIDALAAFVSGGLHDPDLRRYEPAHVPSGACVPINDELARIDLGCDAARF